ncbi:MAG: DsbA family protein [Candidatus Nitrosocaldaceae archaeon]
MKNKRVAILAIIIGVIGVSIGAYSLISISSSINKSRIDISNASPVLGNEDAKITIIEFGDYQCVMCGRWFHNTKPAIMSEYIDKGIAKLYFVDFPIVGPDSFIAAEASYCAYDQGKYWEYHDLLYNNQQGENDGWAKSENLIKLASDLGLDTNEFKECLESGKYKDRVESNREIAIQNGLRGTPSFIIVDNDDKILIVGAHPISKFREVIESIQ